MSTGNLGLGSVAESDSFVPPNAETPLTSEQRAAFHRGLGIVMMWVGYALLVLTAAALMQTYLGSAEHGGQRPFFQTLFLGASIGYFVKGLVSQRKSMVSMSLVAFLADSVLWAYDFGSLLSIPFAWGTAAALAFMAFGFLKYRSSQ